VIGGEVAEIAQDVMELGRDQRSADAEKPTKKHEKTITSG